MKKYPPTVVSILENEKYAGNLLMQKWYVEDYLDRVVVKDDGYEVAFKAGVTVEVEV